MAELGKIQPIKKAACPHCGYILPGKPETYHNSQALKCPKCHKLIKGTASAMQTFNSLPMNFAAQLLQWQLQTKDHKTETKD